MSVETDYWATIATNLKAAITRLSLKELHEISLDGRMFKYRDLPNLNHELRITEIKAGTKTTPQRIVETKWY
ncbi:MAG: hypothetical protein WC209_04835 [Ignavibacteriaceae bacterium]|jgi:hypothetical protein